MAERNGSDVGSFLKGFVVGGLVGAITTLLLAPQSGEDTRAQIRQKGIDIRTRADDEIREIRDRAEQTLAEVRAQADELEKRGKQVFEETRTKVTDVVGQGLETARKAREELAGNTKKTEEVKS